MPASAASTPASAQPVAPVRERRMPMSEAVGPSAAAARIPMPSRVRAKRNHRPANTTTATPAARTRPAGSAMSPMCTTSAPHGAPSGSTWLPIRRVSSVSSTMSTPSMRMAAVPGLGSARWRTSRALTSTPDDGRPDDARRATAGQNPMVGWVTATR